MEWSRSFRTGRCLLLDMPNLGTIKLGERPFRCERRIGLLRLRPARGANPQPSISPQALFRDVIRLKLSRRRAAARAAGAAAVAIVMAVAALGYGLYASSATGSTVSSQSERIGALQSTVGSLQANVTSLERRLESTGGQLNSTQTVLASLEENVTTLQGRFAALGLQLNSAEATDSAALQRPRRRSRASTRPSRNSCPNLPLPPVQTYWRSRRRPARTRAARARPRPT